jgi:hypothetical protein
MKKIIFFSKNLKIGGMEKSLVSLLNNLINDYQITLVLEEKKGVLLSELNKNIIIKEYKLSDCKVILIRKILNFSKRMIWKVKNNNKYNFSCNYATYSRNCSKLALISSKNNSIYIHSNYVDAFNNDYNKINDFFKYILAFNFKNIIFVSEESKEAILKYYPEKSFKLKVINNLFTPLKIDNEVINKTENDKIFLFLGRLDETSKKITRILEAISESDSSNKLWIVGEGQDKEKYIKLTKKLKIENKVTFYGATQNPYKYLVSCDCVILSSDYEGYPVVYLEAIYYKKPIITTIKVHDKYIDIENYGLIVKKDPKSILDGMNKVFSKKIVYNVDFNKINSKKINEIKVLIEGEN